MVLRYSLLTQDLPQVHEEVDRATTEALAFFGGKKIKAENL